ncbi:SOUL heme-binding family protein [Hibiscus syriacus]|uniref:apyrase n=1 Tax=Hibiscus syriacus TaxID=106335 RepID=A0A6A2YQ87_HIBSY|nr:SOUL heme-binding family protein [Hibiscus syriacus]
METSLDFFFPVGFLILLSSIGVYLAFNFVKAQNVLESSYYTVVVDCGSTGTRVNVFEWGKGGLISQGLPSLLHYYSDDSTESESCHYHCMLTKPGLDKLVCNASGVRASLEPLIAWAELRVPCERHGDTPIIVLATVGLRRLVARDAKQVLDNVEIVLREHSFVYTKNWIRVLTGGSSLQVVVEVADKNANRNVMTSDIGSTNHKILAYSLPAFGLNEAFDQTVVMLSRNQADRRNASNRLELKHPYLSSNFSQNYTCSGCAMLNITDDLENSEVQIYKNRFSSIHLVGDLKWEKCNELVRAAAMNYSDSDWSEHNVDRNCEANLSFYGGSNILNLTPLPITADVFMLYLGFFVYNMLKLSTRASVTEIWEKVIEDALCLGNSKIVFGPGDLSWTLGAVLVHQLNANEALPNQAAYAGQEDFQRQGIVAILLRSCKTSTELISNMLKLT